MQTQLSTTATPYSDVTDLKKKKKRKEGTSSLLSGHVVCFKKKKVGLVFFSVVEVMTLFYDILAEVYMYKSSTLYNVMTSHF